MLWFKFIISLTDLIYFYFPLLQILIMIENFKPKINLNHNIHNNAKSLLPSPLYDLFIYV